MSGKSNLKTSWVVTSLIAGFTVTTILLILLRNVQIPIIGKFDLALLIYSVSFLAILLLNPAWLFIRIFYVLIGIFVGLNKFVFRLDGRFGETDFVLGSTPPENTTNIILLVLAALSLFFFFLERNNRLAFGGLRLSKIFSIDQSFNRTTNNVGRDQYNVKGDLHMGRDTKPKVQLGTLDTNIKLLPQSTYHFVYGVPDRSFKEGDFIIVNFEVEIACLPGSVSLKQVFLDFVTSYGSLLANEEFYQMQSLFGFDTPDYKVSRQDNKVAFNLKIPEISPNSARRIHIQMMIPFSEMSLKIPATTKDGVDVVAKVKVDYAIMAELVFRASDVDSQLFKFHFQGKSIQDKEKFHLENMGIEPQNLKRLASFMERGKNREITVSCPSEVIEIKDLGETKGYICEPDIRKSKSSIFSQKDEAIIIKSFGTKEVDLLHINKK